MNASGATWLEHNGDVQLAIVKLIAEHPTVTFEEWASHLMLCGAALGMAAGCEQNMIAEIAAYAVNLAYSTVPEPAQHIH
jgi:hypothetical protein